MRSGGGVDSESEGRDEELTCARPLRVLLHTAAPKADAGGVQNVVWGLAHFLKSRGHEVVTAWPDGDDSKEEWRVDLTADVGASGYPGPGTVFRAAREATGLLGRLAWWRPDVVDMHFPGGQSMYFTLLSRLLGYRTVLSFHNTEVRLASPALAAALPGLLKRTSGATAVSNELADLVRQYRPETDVKVIPNGADTDFWSAGPADRDPHLAVAAGRLVEMKGFDVLLDAFAASAPAAARLKLAGEGEERGALEAQVRELGLEGRVEFTGRLDREGLRSLYKRAGLFVLPSRREGMPLALIEAMAAGLPVIAAKVNGVPDVMTEDCGEMVEAEDADALGAALGRWLGHADRLAKAGTAACFRAREFSEEKSFASYEKVFNEVMRA